MKELFRISTNRFSLDWHRVRDTDQPVLARILPVVGRLALRILSEGLELRDDSVRSGSPDILASDTQFELGPPLFEQTDYQLYLRCIDPHDRIELKHRDPAIRDCLSSQENSRVLHGVINFRGQIGRSQFSVYVNGKRQLDFEVEVFPTKVDYESDYRDILADVQSVLTSLAYEYLRSTFQLGKLSTDKRQTKLEWLVLIEHVIDELEESLNYIASRPTRGLIRREQTSRIEKIRRVDARVRSQVRRGQGKGNLVRSTSTMMRERLIQQPAELTLDTMEHRWIRSQLLDIQRTLGQIILIYVKEPELSPRRKQTRDDLTAFERRIARLLQLEPLVAAAQVPPTGFVSLQLVSAPGYRETYRLLMLLKMGIRLEGDFVRLAVKDLEVLYEYWTYLTIVRLIQEEYGPPERLSQLFRFNQTGLSVRLRQGTRQCLSFKSSPNRRISVTYNPQFADRDTTLIPQKPDILIRLEEQGWPIIQLVCDAKYRIDASAEYFRQFNSFGPPADAVNVLHRYRDAILEIESVPGSERTPKRSVVQAAALFPFDEREPGEFKASRLWQSIERLGVGAIPALPSNLGYMKEWLLAALRQGGWALADRVIPHFASERAHDWRIAASEPVLVGVLRAPGTREHLDWIIQNGVYYQPLTRTQKRQFYAKQIAIYTPSGMDRSPGIHHVANVANIEIRERRRIPTPWRSRGDHDTLMVVYHLNDLRGLEPPITAGKLDDTTIRRSRWTTRLGLERARSLGEIALETEPEWKLFELLQANNIGFKIRAQVARLPDPDNPKGRAWFHLGDGRSIRYDGSNGFLLRSTGRDDRFVMINQILSRVD